MKLDILALAAHPDDVELSCSGTLMAHAAMGKKVGVVDFTEGELGSRGTVETRYEEAKKAAEIMGLDARENLQMADGFFQNDKTNQLKLITAIRKYRPDIVLANAITDRHPDHGKGASLSYDAVFMSGLKMIETFDENGKQEAWRPRLLLNYLQDRWLKPDIVVDISEFWKRKMDSILAYSTQFYNPDSKEEVKTYISSKKFMHLLEARAREMGRPSGFEFAEGFTSTDRFLGVKNLMDVY